MLDGSWRPVAALDDDQAGCREADSLVDIVGEIANVAVELSIEHSSELLGEAAGSLRGLLKILGTAAWKIGAAVRRQVRAEQDPLRGGAERIESIVEPVLEDLARLFDPRSRNYAGAPLVLLIDDAQFADRAEATDRFVARLISRATSDRWLLLLVLTNWSRDLSEWTDGAGRVREASHAARIIEHTRYGLEDDPGPFGGAAGERRKGGCRARGHPDIRLPAQQGDGGRDDACGSAATARGADVRARSIL